MRNYGREYDSLARTVIEEKICDECKTALDYLGRMPSNYGDVIAYICPKCGWGLFKVIDDPSYDTSEESVKNEN